MALANVEYILMNYDDSQKAMDKYMVKSKINFPALKHSETKTNALATFHKTEFLPTVVLASAEGKVISTDLATVLTKLKEAGK